MPSPSFTSSSMTSPTVTSSRLLSEQKVRGKVVDILVEEPVIIKEWVAFCGRLEIPDVDLIPWEQQYAMGTMTNYALVSSILRLWASQNGEKANVSNLCGVLKKCNLITCMNKVKKEFELGNGANLEQLSGVLEKEGIKSAADGLKHQDAAGKQRAKPTEADISAPTSLTPPTPVDMCVPTTSNCLRRGNLTSANVDLETGEIKMAGDTYTSSDGPQFNNIRNVTIIVNPNNQNTPTICDSTSATRSKTTTPSREGNPFVTSTSKCAGQIALRTDKIKPSERPASEPVLSTPSSENAIRPEPEYSSPASPTLLRSERKNQQNQQISPMSSAFHTDDDTPDGKIVSEAKPLIATSYIEEKLTSGQQIETKGYPSRPTNSPYIAPSYATLATKNIPHWRNRNHVCLYVVILFVIAVVLCVIIYLPNPDCLDSRNTSTAHDISSIRPQCLPSTSETTHQVNYETTLPTGMVIATALPEVSISFCNRTKDLNLYLDFPQITQVPTINCPENVAGINITGPTHWYIVKQLIQTLTNVTRLSFKGPDVCEAYDSEIPTEIPEIREDSIIYLYFQDFSHCDKLYYDIPRHITLANIQAIQFTCVEFKSDNTLGLENMLGALSNGSRIYCRNSNNCIDFKAELTNRTKLRSGYVKC